MDRSQISLRTVFTVCFGAMVMVALAYAVLQTRLAIALALVAAMIAVALDHAVAMLQRRRLPRWLAISTVCLVVLGMGGLIGATVIPSAVAQTQVLASSAPTLVDNIRKTPTFKVLDKRFGVNVAIDRVGMEAPTHILGAVNAVVGVAVGAIAVVLLAVFMLIFGAPLIQRALEQLDPAHGPRLRETLGTVYRLLGGYIAGISVIAACNAIATATFLAILGMPFFLPLALMSGLASTVPYVGSIVTSITISLLALASIGSLPAVACVIFFITFGQLEGNVLGPMIFRRMAKVNPLVTVLAILFFGTLGGVMGAFLAIPLVGMLQLVLRDVFKPAPARLGTIDQAAG
jgi:predicted PurR-regulated permease PerM